MGNFEQFFDNMQEPVVICRNVPGHPLVYQNPSARSMLYGRTGEPAQSDFPRGLEQVVRFQRPEDLENFLATVSTAGAVSAYRINLYHGERTHPVLLTANRVTLEGVDYTVLYIRPDDHGADWTGKDSTNVMNFVFQIAYNNSDIGEAVNQILRAAGNFVQASRAYIIEEVSPDNRRIAYEWCAAGVDSVLGDRREIEQALQVYGKILRKNRIYACADVQTIEDPEHREILEKKGIRSIVVFPMLHADRLLGYVAFDDCTGARRWSKAETDMLLSIAGLCGSLLTRLRAEKKAARTLEIMQTISDSMDDWIHATTLDTHELIFINKAMADSRGKSPDEMVGKRCYEVLHGYDAPCSNCPIPQMVDEDGNINVEAYSHEIFEESSGKWFLVKDAVIEWMDGQRAHVQTATEITSQKQYAKDLEHVAYTDGLTGLYNREWGYRQIQDTVSAPVFVREELSLCFIDLDGLKITNDTYGHDAGDDMILRTVDTIRAATRKSDLLFRWGGDEFILVLQCDPKSADNVMRGIQDRLDEFNRSGEKPYKLSFSYGITGFEEVESGSVQAIVSIADKRMYQNKIQKRKS